MRCVGLPHTIIYYRYNHRCCQLRQGDPFPSVRALSKALKINPNTAHKVVQHLIQERWLEVRPGIGTVVAELPETEFRSIPEIIEDIWANRDRDSTSGVWLSGFSA